MKVVGLLIETRTICSLPAAISVCIILNWFLSVTCNNQSGCEPLNLENGLSVNSDNCTLNVQKLCSATLTPVSSVLFSKRILKWKINTLRPMAPCVLKHVALPIIIEQKSSFHIFKNCQLSLLKLLEIYGILEGEFGFISGCEPTYLITGIVAASAITSRSSCLLTRATMKSQNPDRTLCIIDN